MIERISGSWVGKVFDADVHSPVEICCTVYLINCLALVYPGITVLLLPLLFLLFIRYSLSTMPGFVERM